MKKILFLLVLSLVWVPFVSGAEVFLSVAELEIQYGEKGEKFFDLISKDSSGVRYEWDITIIYYLEEGKGTPEWVEIHYTQIRDYQEDKMDGVLFLNDVYEINIVYETPKAIKVIGEDQFKKMTIITKEAKNHIFGIPIEFTPPVKTPEKECEE